jgi:formiminoglutamate deiminase
VTAYHCELAWLGGDAAEANVSIEVTGDRITSVESGVPAPPDARRLPGLTLPGLANAHSHAFHRALRGRTQTGTGSFWTWREQMYSVAATLDPDSYFRLARAVYGEMVLAGITCVGEFHYLHHAPGGTRYSDANAMGAALVAAADEAGLRITLLDTCYLHGGFHTELNDVQRRYGDGDAAGWAARAAELSALESTTTRVGAAIHSVRAVAPSDIGIVAEWAANRHAPLHAHVSEQPAENEQCLAATGRTPTELFAEHGALSERFTAVHATHLTAADIHLLGSSRCTACFCPTTERDLADGIGPARGLREAGARLSLGSDSNAVIDLFEEARAVELNERLATQVRGSHDAISLLRAATSNGHRSLGWGDAGTIAVGSLADFITVRLDTLRTAGTRADHALESAVFAATAADVAHVVVGGRVVVADGRHCSIDVAAELGTSIAALERSE